MAELHDAISVCAPMESVERSWGTLFLELLLKSLLLDPSAHVVSVRDDGGEEHAVVAIDENWLQLRDRRGADLLVSRGCILMAGFRDGQLTLVLDGLAGASRVRQVTL